MNYWQFELHPKLMQQTLDGAIAAGVERFVLIGTVYPYGRPRTTPVKEDHPREPHTFKGRMRKAQEDLLMAADAAGKIKGTVLRLPDFYGPGVDSSFLAEAFKAAVNGGTANLVGSPIDTPPRMRTVPARTDAAWYSPSRWEPRSISNMRPSSLYTWRCTWQPTNPDAALMIWVLSARRAFGQGETAVAQGSGGGAGGDAGLQLPAEEDCGGQCACRSPAGQAWRPAEALQGLLQTPLVGGNLALGLGHRIVGARDLAERGVIRTSELGIGAAAQKDASLPGGAMVMTGRAERAGPAGGGY